ncbi:MAG: metalloprotease TldD, partial [Gammaproteobacteria bacterium]|nr:metalloprotease TldD [Gammaproteobacteria bacterium]
MSATSTAESLILDQHGLDQDRLNQALSRMMQHQLDAADLYFQIEQRESWSIEDGIVKSAGFSIDQGVGVRTMTGDKVGFAYADDFTMEALTRCTDSARAIAGSGHSAEVKAFNRTRALSRYDEASPLTSLSDDDKIKLLQKADQIARAEDPAVKQVIASISGSHEHILVAASDGTLATDIRPLIRFNVSVIVERNGKRETASMGGGGRYGYLELSANDVIEHYAKEAVRQALVNLEAVAAPAGTMPVVLGSGWPGVMLHEAVGHGLEGDFNRKGSSTFAGRVGEQVASELCTVVDDGTLAGRRGSLTVDDEGTPTQHNVLIEKGILKGFMQDKLNARLSGVAPTGNGRRESYAHLPMPRMTNTYM